MEIRIGHDRRTYYVFASSYEREAYDWLFEGVLGMRVYSFGQFENAFGT